MYVILAPLNNLEWVLKLYFLRAGPVPYNQEEIHRFQLFPKEKRTTHPAMQLLRPTTQVTGTKTPKHLTLKTSLTCVHRSHRMVTKKQFLMGTGGFTVANSLRISTEKARKNIHDWVPPWK